MRPRLLDLFCGAGGASVGYVRAGFEVVGCDHLPQRHYPFEFHQGDALSALESLIADDREFTGNIYNLEDFDAIHASPPCQGYANVTLWRGSQGDHTQLIEPTRRLLEATGLPYVIENVRTREIRGDLVLCGSMFDLPVRRHRHFETNWLGTPMVQFCQHKGTDRAFMHKGERDYADSMGCHWMSNREARQAIPPVYTEWIGERLMAAVQPGVSS